MMAKETAVEVGAVAVGGRKQWLAICLRENLTVAITAAAAIMATAPTVGTLMLAVVLERLAMISLKA